MPSSNSKLDPVERSSNERTPAYPRRKLLTPRQVHETYGNPFSPSWLERKRREGGGPRFLKAGRGKTAKIYYRFDDLDAWVDEHLFVSTSESGQVV